MILTKRLYLTLLLKGSSIIVSYFSARAANHKISRLHERGLGALLNDETSTFNDMLSKSKDTNIHVKNIRKLMIEFYKHLYALSVPIMKDVFTKRIIKYSL